MKAEVDKTMTKLDKDSDGFLSKDELKTALDDLQQVYTDKELQQILEAADTNNDGRISKQELTDFVKSTQSSDEEEEAPAE